MHAGLERVPRPAFLLTGKGGVREGCRVWRSGLADVAWSFSQLRGARSSWRDSLLYGSLFAPHHGCMILEVSGGILGHTSVTCRHRSLGLVLSAPDRSDVKEMKQLWRTYKIKRSPDMP